jgi:hypothetical protein
MPGIFHQSEGKWHLVPLGAAPRLLRLDPVSIERAGETVAPLDADACVLVHIGGHHGWAALVAEGAALLHNGARIGAGLRLLAHRDALALSGGQMLFFTTEEQAHVETFAADAPVSCPRCRSEVHPGEAVVRCPACGVVHHETSDRNCWTYAPVCALCPQPTAFDAALRWTPEEL